VIIIATVAELMVKISADMTGLSNGLKGAGDKLGGFSSSSTKMSKAISIGVVAAGAAIVTFAGVCMKMASDAEVVNLALNNLTGSSAKTTTMVNGLQTAFKGTTFSMPGLKESSEVLLKMGFSAQQVVPIMKDVGNAVASVGGGKAQMDEVDATLGKINQTGKVTTKQLTSMSKDGVDAMGILGAKFKETGPQLQKSISSGAISSKQILAALTAGMAAKYGGDMQKAADTVNGKMTIIKNQALDAMEKLGGILNTSLPIKGVLDAIIKMGTGFADIVDKSKNLGDLMNNMFPPGMQVAIVGIAGAILALMMPALATLATSALIAAGNFGLLVAETLPLILIFAGIAIAALLITKYWSQISAFFKGVWTAIKTDTMAIWTSVSNWFKANIPLIIAIITGPIGLLVLAIVNHWTQIKTDATNMWTSIKTFFSITIPAIVNGITTWIATLPGKISSYFSSVYTQILTWLTKAWSIAVSTASKITSGISSGISSVVSKVGGYFSSVYTSVSTWMSKTWSSATSLASRIASGIASGIASIPGKFSAMGGQILSYLGGLAGQLGNKALSMGASLWAGFKNGIGLHSPSYIEKALIAMGDQTKTTISTMSALAPSFQTAVSKFTPPALIAQTANPGKITTAIATTGISGANTAATAAPTNEQTAGTVNNYFNIKGLTVRTQADIKLIAQQLFRLQQSQLRGQGGTI
jgi:tape measure domain-containing protein